MAALDGKREPERDEAALALIAQIETLRMLFPEGKAKKVDSDHDGSDGMLYLCRFASADTSEVEEKKEK